MLQAMAYGSSVKTAQSSASMARRAEFQQIAARTLDAALSERALEVFAQSLKEVVRARGGFTAVARKTGLNRTALYRTPFFRRESDAQHVDRPATCSRLTALGRTAR